MEVYWVGLAVDLSKLAGKVADMALEWGKGNEISVDDILLFLKDWVLSHILTEDIQIGAALKSKQKTTV